MTPSQSPPPFFSKTPLPVPDRPLSAQGRFNRLSYLGWYGFLNIILVILYLCLAGFTGVLSFTTLAINDDRLVNFFSSTMGIGVIILWAIATYFHFVFMIRRLHDLNRSGWLSLLIFIPIVQFFFILYMVLASGTSGYNDYGAPRPSAVWEKIVAWLMIIIMLLGIVSFASLISFMMGSGELETPTQIVQKGTGYF